MAMPSMPELINDRYKVGEIIGRGGMATVHLGEDVRLGRRVAIKVLRPELAADDTFHERFQREAHAVASLNHHSIVSIYDTGEIKPVSPDGVVRPYIVMEYVPGKTLRELMFDHGIAPRQAIEYMLGILDALSFSHRAGIVHRDIKPANVKVTPDGTVKVMDFGIARAVEDTQASLTQTQAVLGTAQYLSPEQARWASVDPRSDLYSAACVLFEMLTGRAPFVGESSVAIAAQHVRDAPPAPSALNPQLPVSVDRFMKTALAKDRDYRYEDAAHMRRALRTVLAELPDDLDATRATQFSRTMDSRTKSLPVVGPVTASGGVVAVGRGEATEPRYRLDPDEGTGGSTDEEPVAAATSSPRRRRGAWIIPAVLVVLLLTGLGVAGGMAVQWWQSRQVEQTAMVTLPDVTDTDRTTAENTLRDAGVNPTFTTENHDSIPDKHVIATDPTAGTQVAHGSSVVVRVSNGPASVDVPDNLVGLSLDAARNALRDAGLRGGTVTSVNSATAPQNTVVATDPAGGTSVPGDSAVNLQVSTGRVSVPDLVGRTRDEAQEILRGQDVQMDYDVAVQDSQDAATGTVLAQSVPAGTAVAQRSTITLTIARHVAPEPAPTPTPWATEDASEEPSAQPTEEAEREEPSEKPRDTPAPRESKERAPSPTARASSGRD